MDPGGCESLDHARMRIVQTLDQQVGGIVSALAAGLEEAAQNLLGVRAGPGPVSSEHLSIDDSGADRLLGPVVGGGDLDVVER